MYIYIYVCFVLPHHPTSVLALSKLTEHADCVLPVENQSLLNILRKVDTSLHSNSKYDER